MSEYEPEAVRGQLERILASDGFANSERISRFLRFTLESTLNGERDQIKEYVIGREVFDRDDRYDPRIDPIVRVEARRLRARLAEYYEGPGRGDAIRIELPKGGYVPLIAAANGISGAGADGTTVRGRGLLWIAAAGVLLLAVTAAALYSLRSSTDQEMIAVIPGNWFRQSQDGVSEVEEGLAETIAAELANRGAARLVAWPLLLRSRTGGGLPSSLATEMGASKLLLVYARKNGSGAEVTLFFADAVTNQKYWTLEHRLANSSMAREQSEAARIADAIEARLAAARE
jgi:hypothetical protein